MTYDDWLPWIPFPNRMMSPFMYFGGKGILARKIVPLLPQARVYVEPFCGAASVFWHLPQPYPVEVINDLNGDLVNVFRCLQREETFDRLVQMLINTPYSRAELDRAISMEPADEVERAWMFIVRYNFAMSGIGASTAGSWSRSFVQTGECATPASRWRKRMKTLPYWHDRLTRVQIDNRDAIDVIKYWDSPDTVFYVDPPYMPQTRRSGKYEYDQNADFHERLLETIVSCAGKVALSGYQSELYGDVLRDWRRAEWVTNAFSVGRTRQSGIQGKGGASEQDRVEVLWMNYDPPNDQLTLLSDL